MKVDREKKRKGEREKMWMKERKRDEKWGETNVEKREANSGSNSGVDMPPCDRVGTCVCK